MPFVYQPISRLSIALVLILICAVPVLAQEPTDLTVGPTLVQGDCFDVWVTPISPGMHIDIQYTLNGGPLQTVYDWLVMDQTGVARNVCTTLDTAVGYYAFLKVRNSESTTWVDVSESMTILPQPTALSFDTSSGYAGSDHYIMTVAGGSSMTVRVRYDLNGYQNLIGEITTDGNGQYDSGVLHHYIPTGLYQITGIQNAAAQSENWVNVSVPYTILPAQPTSFYLDKSMIVSGGTNGAETYHMHAGNGADIPIDIQYTIDNSPLYEIDFWPWLYADSLTSWDGRSGDINAGTCTIPGLYRFTAVRNSYNTAWLPVSPPAELSVVGSGAPQISAVSPPIASSGQSVAVTIDGQNFCGVTLTTSYPGLSVGIVNSSDSQIHASFSVSPAAQSGNALVTLHTFGGDVDFYIAIIRNGTDLPLITNVTPSSGLPGTIVTVTIAGVNLVDPVLSTTWPGLTFSNVIPNGSTSLMATFSVSGSAPPGNPTITVTTAAGVATTQMFWVGTSDLPMLSREYIYLGDRVIAVESP